MSQLVAILYRCVVILCLVSCLSGPDQNVTDTLDDSFVNNPKPEDKIVSPICYEDYHQIEASNVSRKLDILLVPDTSGSIKNERSRIAQGFENFIDSLPSNVDYNIGVVLAHSSSSNQSGKLYKKNNEPRVLKSSELDISSIKSHLNTKLFNPKTDGPSDGGEMGMLAVLDALKPANVATMRSQGFLREDASLAVVFIADEQDICAQYPEGITPVPDPNTGEAKSFVKYCIEETVKWRDVNIGSSEYTYKITPELVVNGLKALQGERPLVIGGVLYNENSVFSTGNEDEIGYGYHDMIKLHDGISVDLGSGDYGDGLTKLGRLATAKMDLERTFAVKNQYVNPATIQASVDDVTVGAVYDFELQKIFIDPNFDQLGLIKLNYCSDGQAPVISLDPIETQTDQEVVTLRGSIQDLYFDSYKVFLNESLISEGVDFVINLPITLMEGVNTIRVEAKDKVGSISETSLPAISFTMSPPEITVLSEVVPYTKENVFNLKATITDVFDVTNQIFINNILQSENSLKEINTDLSLAEGVNIIKIVSTNERGKVAEINLDQIVKDTISPVIETDQDSNQSVTLKSFTVSGSIVESNIQSFSLKQNGIEILSQVGESFNQEVELALGINAFEIIVVDLAGNSTTKLVNNINFNPAAPQIFFVNPSEAKLINEAALSLNINIISELTVSSVVTLNDQELLTTQEKSITKAILLEEGTNQIKVVSTDERGSVTESLSGIVTLDSTKPVVQWHIARDESVTPNTFNLDVRVDEIRFKETIVKNNGVEIFRTIQKNFELVRALNSGDNIIEILSSDTLDNQAMVMVHRITQKTDTLCMLDIQPEQQGVARGDTTVISGKSSVPLAEVLVNGQPAEISADGLGYSFAIQQSASQGGP